MSITEDYRLSFYQDYGPLGNKEHIRLVRDRRSGKMCVKKLLEQPPKEILDFRKQNCTPYFPQLLEVLEENGRVIIVEEYIEGITLEEYMMGEQLPEKQAVNFARQICQALQCLHTFQPMIVYRDLKPENIMITWEEKVKLIDFNISRKYQEGKKRDTALLGTAEYAAPEQFGYFQTDNRTDIYAFGILFNYMLTGKFPIEYVAEGKYAGMVRKCIELEPAKRYQRVEELLKEFPKEEMPKKQTPEQSYQREAMDEELQSWTIPGFRTKKLWKMVVAVIGYAMILYMGLTVEFHNEDGSLYPMVKMWINRIFFTISQIMTVLFIGNYRGISDKLTVYHHPSRKVRWMSFVLTWIVMMFIAAIGADILERIFHV